MTDKVLEQEQTEAIASYKVLSKAETPDAVKIKAAEEEYEALGAEMLIREEKKAAKLAVKPEEPSARADKILQAAESHDLKTMLFQLKEIPMFESNMDVYRWLQKLECKASSAPAF